WMLANRIDATDYAPFQGLRVGYHLTLRQDGARITGEGEKQTENGAPLPPGQRSPIVVTGRLEGGVVTLHFPERGALRTLTAACPATTSRPPVVAASPPAAPASPLSAPAPAAATSAPHPALAPGPLPGMPPVLDPGDIYSEDRPGRLSPVVRGFPSRVYVP